MRVDVDIHLGDVDTRSILNLGVVDGRYYLLDLPVRLHSPSRHEIDDTYAFAVHQVCECKDRACADKIVDEHAAWVAERARLRRRDFPRDQAAANERAAMERRMTDCRAKLAP
jgi:hypothetical protein